MTFTTRKAHRHGFVTQVRLLGLLHLMVQLGRGVGGGGYGLGGVGWDTFDHL